MKNIIRVNKKIKVIKEKIIKFFLVFFLLIIINFVINFSVLARELEEDYPTINNFKPTTTETPLPEYVRYIFNFVIVVSGIIALIMIVVGGIEYLTGAGNLNKIESAKEKLISSISGLVILLGSWILLYIINPQLTKISIPNVESPIPTLKPGVLVCNEEEEVVKFWNLEKEYSTASDDRKKEIVKELSEIMDNISKHCYYINTGGDIKEDFKVKYIYLIPKKLSDGSYKNYGAIIYEDKNYEGKNNILDDGFGAQGPVEKELGGWISSISSIRPFIFVTPDQQKDRVVLYEDVNFNYDGAKQDALSYNLDINTCIVTKWIKFTPQSVKVKGNAIAYLSTSETPDSDAASQVFLEPGDRDLNSSNVSCWHWCGWWYCEESCVKKACAYSVKLY